MSKLNYLPFAKRIVTKKGASPLYFVLFITKNCFSRAGTAPFQTVSRGFSITFEFEVAVGVVVGRT